MNDKVAVLFIGIQASGKSTFYHKYFKDYVHVNLDTVKKRSKEKKLLIRCIENGESFVVDNTNPTAEVRRRYFDLLEGEGYRIIGYYFKSSINDCLERNRRREGRARIPDVGVRDTYARMEFPSYSEGFDELYYVALEGDDYTVDEWNKDE
jgi:predicted kinase